MQNTTRIRRFFKGIVDSTLREGFQFRGADFTREDMQDIFGHLAEIGVDYIEVGNPAGSEVRSHIEAMIRRRPNRPSRVLSHIRNHAGDLRAALECGVDGVNILCSVDPERLKAMHLSRDAYLRNLRANLAAAAAAGKETRVGIEDFFNQDPKRSEEIFALAEESGADRVCLSDTLGRALGWEVAGRIREARKRHAIDFEVHFHNDLGHAVSNALIAVESGANWVDTSLLGIGERTGITPLSSFLINLHLIHPDIASRYELTRLTEAECRVSKACRMDMPIHLPTNPFNGFAHKAGIHLDAVLKLGPHKYEPLSPSLIGNRRALVTGTPISGKTTRDHVRDFENRRAGRRRGVAEDREGEPC
jgi:homocitrate synthase